MADEVLSDSPLRTEGVSAVPPRRPIFGSARRPTFGVPGFASKAKPEAGAGAPVALPVQESVRPAAVAASAGTAPSFVAPSPVAMAPAASRPSFAAPRRPLFSAPVRSSPRIAKAQEPVEAVVPPPSVVARPEQSAPVSGDSASTAPSPAPSGLLPSTAGEAAQSLPDQLATNTPTVPLPQAAPAGSAGRPRFGGMRAADNVDSPFSGSDFGDSDGDADVQVVPAKSQSKPGRPRFLSASASKVEDADRPVFDDGDSDDGAGDFDAGGAEPGRNPSVRSSGGRPSFLGATRRVVPQDTGPKTVEIIGRLDSLKMIGDWAVGQIWNDSLARVKITGKDLSELVEGLEYVFVGYNKTHPTYGDSLEVVAATPHISPSLSALTRFISINFKGVGLFKADRFVKSVQEVEGVEGLERLRHKLINEPHTVDLSGLADGAAYVARTDEASDVSLGRQSAVYRELATKVGSIPGVRSTLFKGLAKWLVARNGPYEGSVVPADLSLRCWAMFALDPYTPIRDVEGYDWTMADAIGRATNVPRDQPQRLSALVKHALDVGCEQRGHTFLSEAELLATILRIDPRVNVTVALQVALRDGLVVQDSGDRIYPVNLFKAEKSVAQSLSRLITAGDPLLRGSEKEVNADISKTALKLGFKSGLDDSQLKAVSNILRSPCRIHTLTGGPGCGKTSVMEVLASMLPHKEIVFATPTGKAAKVLSNRLSRLGLSASTLHSTLGGGVDGGFAHNEEEPLLGDLLVIDESSIPDLELMDAALRAMNDGMHLILLGDPAQLPSIGPGRVLRDILELQEVDHNHLSTTHRNSGGILELIQSCGAGRIEIKDTPGVHFSRELGAAKDQFSQVADAYRDAVARRGYENVILLMSRRKGKEDEPDWNTTYANSVLRKLCNPDGVKIPGTNLHVNDRIIITANMEVDHRDSGSPERVVNGDTGTIIGCAAPSGRGSAQLKRNITPDHIDLRLDDGRTIRFPGQLAPTALSHSYALTVHAGQGSEYKEVILVATPGAAAFINQNMLFTGLSRAREDLKIFANNADLVKIAATPSPPRNSALVERVKEALESDTPVESERIAQRG